MFICLVFFVYFPSICVTKSWIFKIIMPKKVEFIVNKFDIKKVIFRRFLLNCWCWGCYHWKDPDEISSKTAFSSSPDDHRPPKFRFHNRSTNWFFHDFFHLFGNNHFWFFFNLFGYKSIRIILNANHKVSFSVMSSFRLTLLHLWIASTRIQRKISSRSSGASQMLWNYWTTTTPIY